MELLHQICSLPTAPFIEDRIIAFVEEFARTRKLKLKRDRYGNLLIELPGKSKGPRWVFAAHMDHPGMVAGKMLDEHTLAAEFRGWVSVEYLVGTKVRFFSGKKEIRGEVIRAISEKNSNRAQHLEIRVREKVARGSAGMFDVGAGRVKGKKFLCRVCDDLAGMAGALAMVDELLKKPATVPVAVLLTRAEEEAFIGAVGAVLDGTLLRKSDRLIAIETSAQQPAAPIGKGPVIRVGDRTSIFNSSITWFLTQQAAALAKEDSSFIYQRALMPGGTCEATVYDIWGYLSSSICVALGNYHNMDTKNRRIAAEFIDVDDWKNMVKLFVRIARHGHEYQPGHIGLKKRIEDRFHKMSRFL